MIRRALSIYNLRHQLKPKIKQIWRRFSVPPIGSIEFGDLRRLSPINSDFGVGRGTPIDRYYIEEFLSRHAGDIRGRVLEAGSNRYALRFGGSRVDQTDVLSVETTNPRATIVADLAQAGSLPQSTFDCIILTQVLQYVYDLRIAVATLHRALKPGGVLLITVPAVKSQTGHDGWCWYWWFTAAAIRRLLQEAFLPDAVTVETFGNILVTTAFHYGIALEELKMSELQVDDPEFPVIVAGRATKANACH